jgi:hypothetical protein
VRPGAPIKLLGDVRDREIVDSEGHRCGICDDIELLGQPGEPLRIANLLVGPGAYERRLPGWMFRLIARLVGRRITRVPWQAVDHITGRIVLNVPGSELGLRRMEAGLTHRLRRIPLS